jgi:hypothetical protein
MLEAAVSLENAEKESEGSPLNRWLDLLPGWWVHIFLYQLSYLSAINRRPLQLRYICVQSSYLRHQRCSAYRGLRI